MVDSTQSVSTWTSISSQTQDQHNQVLLIHSLLSSPCHFSQACFLCFGRNTFTAQRHFGIICVLPGLWSFVFSVCVLPCSCEREGGPGPSLKTLCDLLSPAPCLSLSTSASALSILCHLLFLDLILVLCFENSIFFPAPVLNNDFVILAAENVLNFQLSIIQLSLKV